MTAVMIEERSRGALLEGQSRVLERIAGGAPLEETLEMLVGLIEEQTGDMRCAVLLVDAQQQRLYYAAAPRIPEDYKRSVEPLMRIAPDTGTCGAAAFLRCPVYTRDITTDPRWRHCAEIAERNGLRAIWSTPILSDAGDVLGTFAMHYGEPRLPSEDDVRLIDMATQLARIAIEANRDDELVRAVFEHALAGMLITDIAGNILRVNPAFAKMLGYTPAELHGKGIADIAPEEDNAALIEELLALSDEEFASGRRRYRSRGGAVLLARQRSALRRDSAGRPLYVVARVERMTEAGNDPLERLSRRERAVLELVIAGRTSKEIGARLGVAAASVDTYRSRIMQKLGIDDIPSLVRFAIRHGIATV